jgi:type IV pilus assembly protein PilY1
MEWETPGRVDKEHIETGVRRKATQEAMMKRVYSPFRFLVVIFAFLVLLPAPGIHADMTSYCQQPPYIIQNAAPNILFMESTSKNMNRFAYYDGFLDSGIIPTTDNLCITDNCTKFTRPGTYPAYKYTGFFNPDYWYTWSNSGGGKYTRSNAKTAGRPANGWDGNFLNWLTMRRFDILQQVLIGKKRAADNWEGQGAADASAGLWKRIANAENYIDPAVGSGTVTFKFNLQSGGQTSDFTLSGGGSGTFKVSVDPVAGEKSTGVFQDVFPKARAGIAQASGDGMRIWSKIDFSWNQADINQIVNTPSSQLGNQGLANQLYGIAGYFANMTSFGSWSPTPIDYNWNYMTPNKDPMNYNGQYYGCASNYVIFITDGDPSGDGSIPSQLKNYANSNPHKSPFTCGGNGANLPDTCQGGTIQGVTFSSYSFPSVTGNVSGLEDLALWVHTTDLRSPTIGYNDISGKQNLTLYVVNAFGSASTYLKYAAINGGFDDLGTGIPDTRSTWDKGGSGVPYNYYEAKDKDQLQSALTEAVNSILKVATSGTAASVLASGEGSGANLLQAVFYPRRRFSNDIIMWAGSLQNLWYYVDPYFGNATIREETPTADGKLNLQTDRIVQFFFDNNSQTTKVSRTQDVNGDGKTLVALDNVFFEDMSSLWEAGKKLYYMSPSGRVIKTTTNGSSFTPFEDTSASATALSSHLDPVSPQTAAGIIRYTLGYDDSLSRNRTVEIGSDNNVWKLGDILTSTPRIVSSIPLVKYYETYSDDTYGPVSDNTTFTGGTTYKNRGMVFAGGNDGMLHAFKLGKLEQSWTGQNRQFEKAQLTNLDNVPLGQEMWGFIPKNALPYLKYLSDNNYCHLAYVDLPPYVFDASIGGNPTDTRTAADWRTILIGGMRTGGACKDTCATSDCVKTPATGKGFSSYFALDVTDPTIPSLLWEFSDPDLGFSTTGPAIVRINALNTTTTPPSRDRSLNGEWYVVFGSGPTGPIDNTYQFLGRSNQPLRLFIRSLKTGDLVQTITPTGFTGIDKAFAGSILNATADYNLDYQDDVVYIPYVKISGTTWTDGGVLRLVPKVSPTTNSVTWAWSRVIDGIGPVTSSVAHLQSNRTGNAWLYFGTGRYYYDHPPGVGSTTSPDIDDPVNRRAIFGIQEKCFSVYGGVGFFDSNCTTTLTLGDLDDVTNIANVKAETLTNQTSYNGWYLNLDSAGTYTYDGAARAFYPERVITDPLASTSGLVYFTAFKPYGDYCAIGGKSFLWALRYNTGGAPIYSLQGKALLQVSTAAIEQLDLSIAFSGGTDSTLHKGGRRSYAMEGVPPVSQGLSILSPPPPMNRILHMKER